MNKPLKVLQEDFPELALWLKAICRYGSKLEDFIITDYKEPYLRLKFYTKDHYYSIVAKLPKLEKGCIIGEDDNQDVIQEYDDGYLGCQAGTRKPRAGEDWTRGNDLADGSYSKETWKEIVDDIIGYELVKVVKLERTKHLD